jgi:hypothetical protein
MVTRKSEKEFYMAAKKSNGKKDANENTEALDRDDGRDYVAPPENVLTSQQEVIDALKMGQSQFVRLLRKYPFGCCGSSGKLNGRWHRYVQRQELRHPDARRLRPEEPPDLLDIRARS